MTRIGLISDTHGLLRPEVLDFLRGSDRIVHAGDICEPAVLAALRALAPLTVVRGNNDRGPWAEALNEIERLRIDGVDVLVVHDLADLGAVPPDVAVVVSGHSHKPRVEPRGGTLYVNPGSAGPRRFRLPISAGELIVADGRASARVVEF